MIKKGKNPLEFDLDRRIGSAHFQSFFFNHLFFRGYHNVVEKPNLFTSCKTSYRKKICTKLYNRIDCMYVVSLNGSKWIDQWNWIELNFKTENWKRDDQVDIISLKMLECIFDHVNLNVQCTYYIFKPQIE